MLERDRKRLPCGQVRTFRATAGVVMGRHSVRERDATQVTLSAAPLPGDPARRPWTRQHKVAAAFLGSSIITASVLIAATNTPHTGGQTGNSLSSNFAAAPQGSGSLIQRPSRSVRNPAQSSSDSALTPAATSRPATVPPSAHAHTSSSSRAQAPPSAPSLAELPIDTALTGSEAVAWGEAALTALGAPTTSANVKTMVDWFANEGTPHDLNNPLNLQTPYGGSTESTADGSPVSAGIQAYPSPADFVAAFPIEMNNGSYPAIVAALKVGTGLEGSAATPEIAAQLSLYSGGGYDSIPAA
jgi:hypothetical protein